jgi:EGF domain-specific O-GlcNAc transferase
MISPISQAYASHMNARRCRIGIVVAILLLFSFTLYQFSFAPSSSNRTQSEKQFASHADTSPTQPPTPLDYTLPLPPEYRQTRHELEFCAERFGLPYLEKFSNVSANYCDDQSLSSLTCFWNQITYERTDSFCIGGPAILDVKENKYKMDCPLRTLTAEELAQGIPRLNRLLSYWYQTGPRFILENYVRTGAAEEMRSILTSGPQEFSILIKREENLNNLWHRLMELFSLFMTLDVLQMTRNPATNKPYFSNEDMKNTQVVILDDIVDDPYLELWSLFARKPIVRLGDLDAETPSLGNIIVPLAGGSNPMWSGDWQLHSCDHSELLRVFTKRVLDFYDVNDEPLAADRPLVLTFIDRKEKRLLVNKEEYISILKSKFPAVKIELVNFAAFSFTEQLKIVRHTDILVGVHGAGLTHGMFMPPGSTMVEILPPGVAHKGFRNMAKLLGHNHFSSHATDRPDQAATGDWKYDDVFLEEDRFMELMDVAIKSMYNRGTYNQDVS